ncbi:hypothetical protein BB559_001814 [Furculomyces boomerangus]|uniref:Peptidase A1 domain-containing protein n=1 Tax=Furculomyces boomerangus TaxID=61424 RepID=A0A2T9Z053_9FUNG|nr:hypothetical protein BB559_001814 [Furculomyces boomerangus]
MLISLLFAAQLLSFGLCAERNMTDAIFPENQEGLSGVITVPLKNYGHEVYIDINVGNPVQTLKAKLDFQSHYSFFLDINSNSIGNRASFETGYSIFSDEEFKKKRNAYEKNQTSSTVLGVYGNSNFAIGKRSIKKHFLDFVYKYSKTSSDGPNYEKFFIGSGDLKSVDFGYLDYNEYESNGFTNGFLGLDPRYKETTPNGFFSSESSFMDFLGPDKMITIDMRDGKSLFSLGNAISSSDTINWIYSVKNDTFEFKIKDLTIEGGSVDPEIKKKDITAVLNPRYRDIYIDGPAVDNINNHKFEYTSGCNIDFGNVKFHTENGAIGLRPQSFLRSDGYSCNSDIKQINQGSGKKNNRWIFGWSFNKDRAIIYDYNQSRVGFVDAKDY